MTIKSPQVVKNEFYVSQRIDFVRRLTVNKTIMYLPELRVETPTGGLSHPMEQFESTCNYLLMTCFDILSGEDEGYQDMYTWVHSGKAVSDCSGVVMQSSAIDTVKAVSEVWRGKFGVGNNFKKYILGLDREIKGKLFDSIRIVKSKIGSDARMSPVFLEELVDEQSKLAFLYETRNIFTHRGIPTGSCVEGKFDLRDLLGTAGYEDIVKNGFRPLRSKKNIAEGIITEYSVKNWPDVLIEVIEAAMV